MRFSSALLCWLPSFTTKPKIEAYHATTLAVPHRVLAPVTTGFTDLSAGLGTPEYLAEIPIDAVPPAALQGIGTGRPAEAMDADAGMASAPAKSRRLLEDEIGSLALAPHDDARISPDFYKKIRFLDYPKIAEEFAAWMMSSPRTAFLIGWPITVDELLDIAHGAFQEETLIVIESRNNFLEALAKRPEVRRENKRVRSDRDDRRWDKKRVYRFLTADQIAHQTKSDGLRCVA
ncbi:MAG: hypothetical protein JSR89_17190 [Proteobacteria bacterium]|nr:hypothetical protein [Pseudomonadota bacterium]